MHVASQRPLQYSAPISKNSFTTSKTAFTFSKLSLPPCICVKVLCRCLAQKVVRHSCPVSRCQRFDEPLRLWRLSEIFRCDFSGASVASAFGHCFYFYLHVNPFSTNFRSFFYFFQLFVNFFFKKHSHKFKMLYCEVFREVIQKLFYLFSGFLSDFLESVYSHSLL